MHAIPSIPTALALALLAAPPAAQAPALVAETFGRASGDAPHPELGLVLELVDPGTPDARLRLFGGLPGHPATLVVSAARAESVAPSGAVTLVGPSALSAGGTFAADGTFELPLGGLELAPGASLYAQGMHAGLFDLGGEPLVQLSHGLELRGAVQESPEPLAFDEFLPHLPARRELGDAAGLAERLQAMLDSAGDSVRVAVEVEATLGLGIEVVDAKAGGKLAFEVAVERTEDGQYEVVLASEVAALAGVSAGTGAEAGAEASGGYGRAHLFRFRSAPGAARGILGMVLALRYPELQPGRALEASGLIGDVAARVAELRSLVALAEEHAAELEAVLWAVLDSRVDEASAARSAASSRLSSANRAYSSAPWWLRPAAWAKVLACRAALAAADARLAVVRAAREQGELAVAFARALLESRRAELVAAVRDAARVARLAASVAQLRGWATEHWAGSEVRFAAAAEVEAQLKAPVVDLKNFGVGASAELTRELVTRWEPARGSLPARVTVAQSLELERKAYAGLVLGGEVATTQALELAETFELGASAPSERSLSLTRDTSLVSALGLIVARESGVGRTRAFTLSGDAAWDLAWLSSSESIAERLGALEVGLELQDRRQENLDVAFAIDVSGTGGGIEIELEWADRGRLLSRATTVAEGVERVLQGASEVPDEATGTVVQVE